MNYTPIRYEHHWIGEAEQLAASRDFLSAISRRRSIHDFASTSVLFELVENAVRAASRVSSGANQ